MTELLEAPGLQTPQIRPYGPDEPPEAEHQRAARAAVVDGLVARNRLLRNAGGAGQGIELRRAPRLSATELNGIDPAVLRRRMEELPPDDKRGPLAQVIDFFDLPRQTNAHIVWGTPTASGVLGSLGQGAAFGAALGSLGGPPGMAAGAAIGAGIYGATQLASLVGRQFVSDETRDALAQSGEGVGAAGQQHLYTSQILDRMGVKSDVARGILGLIGDLAMDPSIYLGPLGGVARITAKVAGGAEKAVALTRTGNKALDAGVAAVSTGREAADTSVNTYLAAKGFTPETVKALLAAGKTEAQVRTEIQNALRGPIANSRLGQLFTKVGHTAEYEGGSLVQDFHGVLKGDAGDAARIAAKKLVESHGVGLSERGLRIGVKPGQAGRVWAHIPFTDIALTLPEMAKANGIGRQQALVISALKNGVMQDAPVVPGALTASDALTKLDRGMTDVKAAAEANAEDLAAHELTIKNLRENPPDAPPPADSPSPTQPPGPDAPPSGAGLTPEGDAITQPLKEGGEGGGPELPPGVVAEHAPSVPRTRTTLIDEMHAAFADVPEEQRVAAVALADARAKAMGMTPEQWWPQHIAGFRRGLGVRGRLETGRLQSGRGAVSFLDDGKALVSALIKPDATTLPHELSHIFRRTLAPAELAAVHNAYKVGDGAWTLKHEERYAADFERYLAKGEAPTEELRGVFEQFRDWIAELYRRIVGTPLAKQFSPAMRQHFDRILGATPKERVAPGRLARGRVFDWLRDATADYRQAIRDVDDATLGRVETAEGQFAVGLDTSFSGKLPGEIKDAIFEGGRRRHLLRYIRTNVAGGRGEDSMLELGADKWVELLERLHGSEEAEVLGMARQVADSDPAVKFMLGLHDEWPVEQVQQTRKGRPKTITRSVQVPSEVLVNPQPNTAVTVAGRPMLVTLNENGDLVLKASHTELPIGDARVPEIHVDKGSVRHLSDEEASAMLDEFDAARGHGPAAGGVGSDDIPLSPDRPLFQPDVAGQKGLWGDRVGRIDSGEQQGTMFDTSKPLESPVPAGESMREGETLEDFKIRMKFKEAEKNTGRLFQDSTLPPDPNEPVTRELMRREAAATEYREGQGARIAAMAREVERVKAAVDAMDPAEYAKTPQTAAAAMRLSEAYHQAVAAIDHAEAEINLFEKIEAVFPQMDHLDAEDFARKLPDALFDAAGASGMRDTLLTSAKADPKVIEDLAEAARLKAETTKQYADLIRGSIETLKTSPDVALAHYAASVLGMADDALGLTMFGRMATMLAGTRTPEKVIETLTALDRWTDRTFHSGKGYMQRAIAREKANIRGHGMVAARWEARIKDTLKEIASAHGIDDKLDELGPLAYSMMYRAVDPHERIYDWRKFSPKGPGHGEPTALAAMLDRAQKSGVLADEKLRGALEEAVNGWVAEVRAMGDTELTDRLLNELMSGYVPLAPADDTRLLMLGQHAAYPDKTGRAGTSATQGYQLKRTTAHTRFPLPDPGLYAGGHWREFYDFDRWVTDRADLFSGGKSADDIAKALNVSREQAQGYQDAFDAITAYDKLVEADPSFAVKYPGKPTDHMTLNELWAQGRFRRLVGNSPEPESLMDGGLPFIMGVRAGAHERSVGMAKIADLVKKQARMASPDLLESNLKNKGMVAKLKNRMEFRILPTTRGSFGGDVFTAEIAGDRFRLLDPGTRSSWLGKLLPDDVLNGGLLPDKLADRIEDVARAAQPGRGDMETLLNSADHLVGMWKKLTLFRPAWTAVDLVGNFWLAASGGARARDMIRHGADIFKLRRLIHDPEEAAKMTLRLGDGRTIKGDELLHALLDDGLFARNLSSEVHNKIAAEDASILWKAGTKGVIGKVFDWNYRANAFSNDWVRGMAFMSHLEQGADAATAARRTLDSLFDWHDFSRVEEKTFRRLIPFYSWMRNNWAYQLHLLTQKPIYAASTPVLAHALEEVMAGNAAVPEEDRPQWMKEQMVTQLTEDPENRIGLAIGNLLPVNDLYDILQAGTGWKGVMGLAHRLTTSARPDLTTIAQLGAGREFFTGKKIAAEPAAGDLSVARFFSNQIVPASEVPKLGAAFDRSAGEGAGRLLLGGRVQAMDSARLASTKEREDRDEEAGLRGAIARARREGDIETATEATARLLRLYQRRRESGRDIPNWADTALARMS